MIVECSKCSREYDDAVCWTFCPHEPFITEEIKRQKDLAFRLLGKKVKFRAPLPCEPTRITSIGRDGMVELEGWSGEFAPHLLVAAEESDESPRH